MRKATDPQLALDTLREMTLQKSKGDLVNWGDGKMRFYRWFTTIRVAKVLRWRTEQVRRMADKYVKEGVLERRRRIGCSVSYSFVRWEGCEAQGDYFIFYPNHTYHDKDNRTTGPDAIPPISDV